MIHDDRELAKCGQSLRDVALMCVVQKNVELKFEAHLG
jgi:hypothetical protein